MDEIDPRLLDTAETSGMATHQQMAIAQDLLRCGHRVFKLTNSLQANIPRDDTPAPFGGELVTALEEISEIGRFLNTKARELINNSEDK